MPEFSLLGGPFHRLGKRLGLVRGETDTFRFGIVIGLLTWGVSMLLAIYLNVASRLFSADVVGLHVRFLVAIPLFFLCETLVAPRMAQFVRDLVDSGMVPEEERPLLAADIALVTKLGNSRVAELLFLLMAFTVVLFGSDKVSMGSSGNPEYVFSLKRLAVPWIVGWYLGFCLPLFRFLMLRWVWHLLLWWFFLWHLQRRNLLLVPIHPDGSAGLGYLEVVQEHFMPLAVANSAILSASLAEEIISGRVAFEILYQFIPVILLLNYVLFTGPLFIFIRKLWRCRITGLSEYMNLASVYVQDFDGKWLRKGEQSAGEVLLGTSDIQSLADLNNSVNIIKNMRWLPLSRRFYIELATGVILPMLPLVFIRYNFEELSVKVFKVLTGL